MSGWSVEVYSVTRPLLSSARIQGMTWRRSSDAMYQTFSEMFMCQCIPWLSPRTPPPPVLIRRFISRRVFRSSEA